MGHVAYIAVAASRGLLPMSCVLSTTTVIIVTSSSCRLYRFCYEKLMKQ